MNTLRNLPKIDKLLAHEKLQDCNPLHVKPIAQKAVEELRKKLQKSQIDSIDEEALVDQIKAQYESLLAPSLVPLVNATGVIVHTNLGRSCLSPVILERAKECLGNYTNLEYALQKGHRGERYAHVSRHLRTLLGVEDVLVVNNNAAAVFLVLNTFAFNKESIVSRGELVEIGGSFRIPDVMARSGSKLIEVGTTNKTRISDYERAITQETAVLMKVHRSNFSIEGFSEEASMQEISKLAKEKNIIDYYDLGSGYIGKLPYGLSHYEPSLHEILKHNPTLVSFSGDKLLGGVQAGIIVGKKSLIQKLKKNQLLRMLRVDKLTLALLEESVKAYLNNEIELIPTLYLLNRDTTTLEKIAKRLRRKIGIKKCDILYSSAYVGGGTMPNRPIPTVALHVKGDAKILEQKFRALGVIGRIESEKFLLDLRALLPESEAKLIKVSKEVLG